MILEHIEDTGYRGGSQESGFLLGMRDSLEDIAKSNRKVVVLGTGQNGFYAEKLLEERGLKIHAFADNSPKLQGKKVRGKEIYSPYELFNDEDVYFIVAVAHRNVGVVRLQLMAHEIDCYSIFFVMPYYDFTYEDEQLQSAIMDSINMVCFEDVKAEAALPWAPFGNSIEQWAGDVYWNVVSINWSHPIYRWGKQLAVANSVNRILEIGPGYGLLSKVLLEEFSTIYIDWIIFGESDRELNSKSIDSCERSLYKIKNKYSRQVGARFGFIEEIDFEIEQKYDLIILTEVFEHFALNPVITVKKLVKSLKADGRIALSTPNWQRRHILESWKELPDAATISRQKYFQLLKASHLYHYSKNELIDIFAESGLKVEKYNVSNGDNHNFLLKKK